MLTLPGFPDMFLATPGALKNLIGMILCNSIAVMQQNRFIWLIKFAAKNRFSLSCSMGDAIH
jgi:hypothetical protein